MWEKEAEDILGYFGDGFWRKLPVFWAGKGRSPEKGAPAMARLLLRCSVFWTATVHFDLQLEVGPFLDGTGERAGGSGCMR
jgi:hypothetical protein